MKALVYTAPYHMELQDLPEPQVGDGEILIKVVASGICGSDVHGFRGRSARRKPPMVMGHEFVGTIEELGDGVDDLETGQTVVVNPLLPCGRCELCHAGRYQNCPERKLVGMDHPGAFAEYVTVPPQAVLPLPPSVSPSMGTMVEPLGNAVHVVGRNVVGLMHGVAVLGAGTQGLLALQMVALVGISPRISTDVEPYRLDVARRMGADLTINPRERDPVKAVSEFTSGRGVDLVIETVGYETTRQQALALAVPGGNVVFLGLHQVTSELDCQSIVAREITLRGSYAYSPRDLETALGLLSAKRVEVQSWLCEAPLGEGQAIFERLADDPGELIKVVLIP